MKRLYSGLAVGVTLGMAAAVFFALQHSSPPQAPTAVLEAAQKPTTAEAPQPQRLQTPALKETKPAANVATREDDRGPKPLSPALVAQISSLLRNWDDEDAPEFREQRMAQLEFLLRGVDTLAVLNALPPEQMNFALALPSVSRWMQANPAEAAAWMSQRPGIGEARVKELVRNWSGADPSGMEHYLNALPPGDWKDTLLAAASRQALSTDLQRSISLASQLSPGPRQTGLFQEDAAEWAKRDPEAASAWVGQVSDPALREQLIGAVASAVADQDPQAAAEWIRGSLRPGAAMDQSVADIVAALAKEQPATAAQWLSQFPEGDGRTAALSSFINVWGNKDRAAATAWATALPEGSLRKEALDFLSKLPATTSPSVTTR